MDNIFHRAFRPQNFVGEYMASKIITKDLVLRKYGPPITSPEFLLKTARKHLSENEEYLKKKRKDYQKKRVEMDQKWNEIATLGQTLKQNFISFNEFMIANSDKRRRAIENLEYNKKAIASSEEEIRNFRRGIEEMTKFKQEIDAEMEKHTIYEKYLMQVLEISKDEGFKNADSIVECYEQYVDLGMQIVKKQAADFEILQNAKGDLTKFEEVQRNVLLGLHTHLAGLRGRYDEALRKTRHLEYTIGKIRGKAAENFTDTMITKEAIRNLYIQMCQKKNEKPKIGRYDFEQQLIFICGILNQYKKLIEQAKKVTKRSIQRIKRA